MTPEDTYRRYVNEYDKKSEEVKWHGPEVLFGLMYIHISPGQSILDLGIGTGLGSIRFYKAELDIYGLDNSPSMLDKCRCNNPEFNLIRHNLAMTPWPYKDNSFNHVISTGFFISWGI